MKGSIITLMLSVESRFAIDHTKARENEEEEKKKKRKEKKEEKKTPPSAKVLL